MAPSSETRVRVERFDIIIAIVSPDRLVASGKGISFVDLMLALWAAALRISVVNSGVERSVSESKCRGAKGDVGGVDGVAEETE